MSGITTPNLPKTSLSDQVLVNRGGTTMTQEVAALASQIMAAGALPEKLSSIQATLAAEIATRATKVALDALAATITSNAILAETRAQLLTVAGTIDGQGAEVMDTDTGTSLLATSTGYNGGSALNAGRYRWVAAWSRWLRIGPTAMSDKLTARTDDVPGVSFAVADPATGGGTFLAVRTADGAPTVDAAHLIARTMNEEGLINTLSINPDGTWRHPSGDVVPAEADLSVWSGWGSSTMAGMATSLTALAAEFGAGYYDGGRGGELNDQTLARQGPVPLTLTVAGGTVPASGPVNVTANIWGGYADPATYEGWLALDPPLPGTLGYDAGSGTRIFTRATAGAAVGVPAGTPFIPVASTLYRAGVVILGHGKNNLNDRHAVEDVVRGNRTAMDWLAPLFRRALILGHVPRRSDTAGSEGMLLYEAVRAYEATRYGRHYIDVGGWLFGPDVWTATGWAQTPEDADDLAAGRLPGSFYIAPDDDLHLTGAVRAAIVTHLIRPRLISLGWFKEPTP